MSVEGSNNQPASSLASVYFILVIGPECGVFIAVKLITSVKCEELFVHVCCLYVYMHVFIRASAYICVHMSVRVYIFVCTFTCMYVCFVLHAACYINCVVLTQQYNWLGGGVAHPDSHCSPPQYWRGCPMTQPLYCLTVLLYSS